MAVGERWECQTPEEFVRRLVTGFVTHGYVFYVPGSVPQGKDPLDVDEKFAVRYGLRISKSQRARRRRLGLANVGYLRWGTFFVLVATHGRHEFFELEASVIRDFRRQPLLIAGYSVSLKRQGGGADQGRWRGSVRIAAADVLLLKRELLERATREHSDKLTARFRAVRTERYAPVRRQLLNVLRAVNRARGTAGLEAVSTSCLELWRKRPSSAVRKRAT